jgi:predicted nucleotidyltransferase
MYTSTELSQLVEPHLGELLPISTTSPSAVFLGGSIIEGFGNATSDVDILVLLTEQVDRSADVFADSRKYVEFPEHAVLVGDLDGKRVDIELRQMSDFQRVLDILEAVDGGEVHQPYAIDDGWLEFLNDLSIGVPLGNREFFEEVRSLVPWAGLRAQLVARFEQLAHSHVEDARGALGAKDAGTAMLSSRTALAYAVDALVAAHGATNPKFKWRVRRMDSLGLSDLKDRYLSLELDADPSAPALLASARRRLVAVQDLLAEAHLVRRGLSPAALVSS